jgi:gas vesicle protein
MANKITVDKVKELLETNAYAPLKEAAQKWLDAADEKYGDKFDDLKEKAAPAVAEFKESVGELKESVGEIKEKAAPTVADLKEKAAPVVEDLKEKAAPTVSELKTKAQPTIDKIAESEFIAALKESISTFSDNIDFFSSKAGEEAVGKEAAEQIRKHAEEMKAQGKTYCDCPACTKAREILKELGEEIEE